MHKHLVRGTALVTLLLPFSICAQETCPNGICVEGVVLDPTGATVSGAQVQTASGGRISTNSAGHFAFPCLAGGSATITASATGFSDVSVKAHAPRGEIARVSIRLVIAQVETEVQVSATETGFDNSNNASTTVLNSATIQQFADDPDDFLRQLQQLAAVGGGTPENAMVVIDGFQNSAGLPPKSSIASIRINPDLYAPEYETPPWSGGRIEISTKPGASLFHGAAFFVDSESFFNATNPLSVSATPATKRRYGFKLTGPVSRRNTDFTLALEKRDINEFNIVNAVTLDTSGHSTSTRQTVPAPQRLWIASARGDWQLSAADVATASFSSNVSSFGNQGVGGLTLADAGYSSQVSQHDLRILNVQTVKTTLLHQTRFGYTWKDTTNTPLSTSPSVQVTGYFLGGGATSQSLNNRERDLEIDDDVAGSFGKHSFKAGIQSLGVFVHNYTPDTFNGAYVFGGGGAPALDSQNNPTGATTTISGIEQYRRALSGLPGGTPTTYQINSGNPLIPFTQWRMAGYAQDTLKLAPRLNLDFGLRYQIQTAPSSFSNFSPRAAISWAPDEKSTWIIHLRAGLFSTPVAPTYTSQVYRFDGGRQQQTTVYSPSFNNPLTPTTGSISVSSTWQFPHTFSQLPSLSAQIGVAHDFPHRWHIEVDSNYGANWGTVRQINVNAPLVSSNIGVAPNPTTALLSPRPISPDENIFRYLKQGHLRGNMFVVSLQQNGYKLGGFSLNYLHMADIRSDGGSTAAIPQSSYSQAGESSRVDWQMDNVFSFSGNAKLPYRFELATQFSARSGRPYNITTGTDANGDGNFNDRPSYASAPGPGVYSTRFGLLSTNTVNGDVPRNIGTMPGLVHLDLDLRRAFALNTKSVNHPLSVTLNARSANLLNHTNITTVNTVLSSSTVGQPIDAEAARRVEVGARFTF